MGMEATSPKLEQGAHGQRWEIVRQWKMRGEPKLAWRYLYFEIAGGACSTIRIHPSTLAAYQGVDTRSGVRALETLAQHGFVEIVDRGGPWIVFLADPLVVAKMRRAHEGDGQAILFDDPSDQEGEEPKYSAAGICSDEPPIRNLELLLAQRRREQGIDAGRDPPADVAQHPPQQPPRADLGETSVLRLDKTSDFGRPRKKSDLARASGGAEGGGSGATSAGDQQPAAALVAAALRPRMTPAQRQREIDRLIAWQLERVRDPQLRLTPCRTAAEAIVDGEYSEHALRRVADALDEAERRGALRSARWCYYVGALKRSMRECSRSLR